MTLMPADLFEGKTPVVETELVFWSIFAGIYATQVCHLMQASLTTVYSPFFVIGRVKSTIS